MSLGDYSCALVTGASSGIGRAVAERLAERGLEVHATARRQDRLAALADETGCVAHALDLRDRAAVEAAFEDLEIDIVVNSAGIGLGFSALYRAAPEDIETTLDTNVLGTARVLRRVLPGMVARSRGHVVNIGSIFGLHAIGSTVYGASKGAIHLLSQNLRLELQGTGIRVSEVCPGRAATEFLEVAAAGDAARAAAMRADFEILTAADVADAVLYVLDAPWRVNVSLIELTATEQVPGGASIVPVSKD